MIYPSTPSRRPDRAWSRVVWWGVLVPAGHWPLPPGRCWTRYHVGESSLGHQLDLPAVLTAGSGRWSVGGETWKADSRFHKWTTPVAARVQWEANGPHAGNSSSTGFLFARGFVGHFFFWAHTRTWLILNIETKCSPLHGFGPIANTYWLYV